VTPAREGTLPGIKNEAGSQESNGYAASNRYGRSAFDHHAIPLNPDYAYTPRKLRVFTIGAGFSGLLIAHKFQHRFPELQDIIQHTIFEARKDLGGTWLVNDYPGVQCDVPSHIYAFPFDPNPDWSRFYSSGPEIEAYIKSTAKKWNLDRDVKLNTKVVGAEWNEAKGEWKVIVELDGAQREEYCDILISGQGVLTHPSWPAVSGLEKFKGHVTHSARWDHNYDYSGKRIAVIGNGSSGIQIVPQMAKLPGTQVRNFIRGPAWVYYRLPPSRHLGREVDDPNPAYSEEEKQRFRDPEEHRKYRKGIIDRTNKSFRLVSLLRFPLTPETDER
jgi:cation diffusion facilitator CzcD-associated flavoprotein CzcO